MFTYNEIINFFRYSEIIRDAYVVTVSSNGKISVTKRNCLNYLEKWSGFEEVYKISTNINDYNNLNWEFITLRDKKNSKQQGQNTIKYILFIEVTDIPSEKEF